MTPKTILTVWEMSTYDVWGNKDDGYEVNDVYRHGEVRIRLKVETNNPGKSGEFQSAYPSDRQLQSIFGTRAALDTDGDDTTIYVNRASDGYQIGELHCVSHSSLSPIRKADATARLSPPHPEAPAQRD